MLMFSSESQTRGRKFFSCPRVSPRGFSTRPRARDDDEFMLHVNLTFYLTSSARAYAGITVLSLVLGLNLPKLDTQAVVIPLA